MPVKLTKLKSGKVKVSTPNGTKAKGTTPAKAKAQERLLNAVDHGFVPTKKKPTGLEQMGQNAEPMPNSMGNPSPVMPYSGPSKPTKTKWKKKAK